jgi:hypothetical protein
MDVMINGLNQCPRSLEAIGVTEFLFEASEERLAIPILPRRRHLAD